MKIKRIKKLRVCSYVFKIEWRGDNNFGGSVDYQNKIIKIGYAHGDCVTLGTILHELYELAAIEMHVRLLRPDLHHGDFLFVFDHRQHSTMAEMVAGWLAQFIE